MDVEPEEVCTLHVWHRYNRDGNDVVQSRGSAAQLRQFFAAHAEEINLKAVWYADPVGEIRDRSGVVVWRFDGENWREVKR